MWSQYDENVKENIFFKELVKVHSDIMKRAAEENWIICIPRLGTLELCDIDIKLILDHVLIYNTENDCNTYSTLSKKCLKVEKQKIITNACQFFHNSIQILFKETIYDEKGKFTVWCVDKPLFLQNSSCDSHRTKNLECLPDCIDFIWVETSGHEILLQIQNLCKKFIDDTYTYELEHMQTQKDLIGGLYSQCLQKILKNSAVKEKILKNDQFVENLKLAVETYMQYCLGDKILFGLSTYLHRNESFLNQIIKNSDNIKSTDLGISNAHSEVLLSAKNNLNRLNSFNTILDKVNCLDRTFNSLCNVKEDDRQTITTDDLIQMFVLLILKLNINNWISNLAFIKDFKFCTSSFTDHVNYLLTTLEAAIEYIQSTHFFSFRRTLYRYKINEPEIFYFVRNGDISSLKAAFLQENSDYPLDLCHPLCNCNKCNILTKNAYIVNKDVRNPKDQTLLTYATIYEQTEIVEYLLSQKVNVNCTDCNGKTALHYASSKGYQDLLLLLVTDADIDVNIQDKNGNTALHMAATYGHESCVKALIYSCPKLNPNICNENKESPLHIGARNGFLEIVKTLLENGASTTTLNATSKTAIAIAHNEHIKNIIQKYSDKKLEFYSTNLAKITCSKNEDNVDCKNHGIRPKNVEEFKKINLLINAIKNNDLPLTCFYLGFNNSEKADVSDKCHPLCHCDKCQNDDIDSCSSVKTEPVAESLHINMCNVEGYTPIHVAAQYGRTNILNVLIDCQADINVKAYKTMYTPLHLACMFQRIQIVRELVRCSNCEINAQDSHGNTALFYAIFKNDTRIIEILLQNNADTDIKNYKGKSVWDECQEKMLYGAFTALKMKVCTKMMDEDDL